MLSDDDILAAVRRGLGAAGADDAAFPAAGAHITRHLLVRGEIVRCVETRTEGAGFHAGTRDLSDVPEYDDLDRYPIPAPADPGAARSTLRLVRRGSVAAHACSTCTNGRKPCARCHGAGDVKCRTHVPCGGCEGRLCCLACEGTGKRAREAADRPQGETSARVRCRKCGAEDAACAKCRGAGQKKCAVCGGTGSRHCPDCGGGGTAKHDFCAGTGRYVEWIEGVIARKPVVDTVQETSGLPARAFGWTNEYDAWDRVDRVDLFDHTGRSGEKTFPADGTDHGTTAGSAAGPCHGTTAGSDHGPDHGTTAGPTAAPTPAAPHDDLAAFLAPRLGVRDGEVARRVSVRYLSLARVTHDHHPHRVYIVVPKRPAPRVVTVRSPRRALRLAVLALLVLVAAVVVARLLS
ncbi:MULTISPECIES: hypothetical protein [unclassified Streptomyces]|uniref:hypothetical protein n=1 Tax=unclassified Streptomyces TaxID=2593676 RepID=UPI003701C295